MKIQKLVYFAHGWHLALRDRPLVDEHPEAWQFGPVFPNLYHIFKEYGSGPITRRASCSTGKSLGGVLTVRLTTPSINDTDDTVTRDFAKSVIERVWEVYGSWTGVQLSHLTHEPDGPWEITWRQNQGRKGTDIPEHLIKLYFQGKIEQPA